MNKHQHLGEELVSTLITADYRSYDKFGKQMKIDGAWDEACQ